MIDSRVRHGIVSPLPQLTRPANLNPSACLPLQPQLWTGLTHTRKEHTHNSGSENQSGSASAKGTRTLLMERKISPSLPPSSLHQPPRTEDWQSDTHQGTDAFRRCLFTCMWREQQFSEWKVQYWVSECGVAREMTGNGWMGTQWVQLTVAALPVLLSVKLNMASFYQTSVPFFCYPCTIVLSVPVNIYRSGVFHFSKAFE